jgi:hypothetical protein
MDEWSLNVDVTRLRVVNGVNDRRSWETVSYFPTYLHTLRLICE